MNFLYDQTAAVIRNIYDSRLDGPPVLEEAAPSAPVAGPEAAAGND